MFLSLAIIFSLGILGGFLFEKIRVPKLVWYILLGILMGPSMLNIMDSTLLNISSYLRQIALVIILTRSGLSLNISSLKKMGRPAILMCFIPACFEIVGVAIFGPMLLHIDLLEALLLGSVLAAVSPAIVVPRMIKLIENGYGREKAVPQLVMAGASCDDIFVIILFYTFKNMVSSGTFNVLGLLQIPTSIILGVALGWISGIILAYLFKKIQGTVALKIVLMLGISFSFLALEESVKAYVQISGLLAIVVLGIVIYKKDTSQAKEIQKGYNNLWSGFEIVLFVLVGAATDIKYALSSEGGIILGLVLIALVFRTLGVLCSISLTSYSLKEKIFIVISYLPKATVQASIGGIALSEGLSCGGMVLTAAVISILLTAPIGAFLMDVLYDKLLIKETS